MRLAEADDGHEVAGARTFFAIAEEKVSVAGRAKIADENIFLSDARFQKLPAIGLSQVEKNIFRRGLVSRRRHAEPLQWIGRISRAQFIKPLCGIRELRREGGRAFGAAFVATTANRRAESGDKVCGARAKLHLHAANRFLRDSSQRAAPAGVNGSHGVATRIDEKNRHAIGGLHAEKQTGTIRCRCVTATDFCRRFVEEAYYVRMKLP